MQSNGDFIPGFAKVFAPLQNLMIQEGPCWKHMRRAHVQQKTFDELFKMLSDNLLLSSFDITLLTYIFTDAHKTGLGVILCEGKRF